MASRNILALILIGLSLSACERRNGSASFEGQWIDLSHEFSDETIYWVTAEPFRRTTVAEGRTEQGYYYSAYNFSGAEHGGTHIDSPVHFAEGKRTVEKFEPTDLIGEAVKIDVSAKAAADREYEITVDDIKGDQAFLRIYNHAVDGDGISLNRVLNDSTFVEGSNINLLPGTIKNTGRDLDVALQGSGFFVVQSPAGDRFTRNGNFQLDGAGQLTNSDGMPVVGQNGPIQLPPGQVETRQFPVMGESQPRILRPGEAWALTVEGEVERPVVPRRGVAAEGIPRQCLQAAVLEVPGHRCQPASRGGRSQRSQRFTTRIPARS